MRTPLALAAAANAVHLALSLALIFPGAMGLTGAALSTSVAEWLAAGGFGEEEAGRKLSLGEGGRERKDKG